MQAVRASSKSAAADASSAAGSRHSIARTRTGFTLKELLIVIGIMALLVSILLPTMGRARRQSRNVQCVSNLRSLQNALIAYITANGHSVSYAPMNTSNPADQNSNLRSMTWEGALKTQFSNENVLY